MIIVAVDYGDVRTGLAVCDEGQRLATPVGVITERNPAALIAAVARRAKELGAARLVVGEPLNMDGSRGERAQKCAAFAKALGEAAGLPVSLVDERCTTLLAHTALNAAGARGKKRKAAVDALSAVLILESYLARHPLEE